MVSFINEEQTDDDKLAGLYRINVIISKDIKNLLIIPDCARIPQVEGFYPPYDNAGYPQDTSIQITFTSPVNLSDFADENGYLKNIAIYENDTNLLESSTDKTPYYANPYLSEDGTKITIPVVSGNYLIPENSITRYRNIKVELDLQNITDAAGTPFKKNDYSYNFRVNSDKDNTPPVLKKLYIARTQEDALNGTNLISFGNSYSDFSNNTEHCVAHIKEHHVKDFWIYFEAEDTGSGVEYLEIKEQQLYASDAKPIDGDVFSQTIVNKDITNKNFSGVYKVSFTAEADGLINVEFAIKDRANNYIQDEDKQKVLLLKDSRVEPIAATVYPSGLQVINSEGVIPFSFSLSITTTGDPWFWLIKNGSTTTKCYEAFEPENTGYWTDDSLEVISVEYGYDLKNLTSYSAESSYICGTLNIDPTKNLYIRTTVKDAVGNQFQTLNTIYSVQNISSYNKTTENKLALYGIDEDCKCYCYFQLKNKGGAIIRESAKSGSIPESNYITRIFMGIKLAHEIEKITWNDNTNTTIQDLYSTYSAGGYLCVTPITGNYMGQTITIDLTKTTPPTLSAEFPEFIVEKLPRVTNSGKTTLRVSNFRKSNGEVFEGTANCSYYLKCYKTNDEANAKYQKIWSFTEPVTIEVENEICEYTVKILASNNKAEKVSASSKTISITVSDDTTPPYVGIKKGDSEDTCIWWEPSTNRLVVKDFIEEDGIGLPEEDYEDEYGIYKRVPIKYCFNSSQSTNAVDWNADYIKTAYYYTQKISSKGSYDPHMLAPFMEFPREGSKNKEFHVIVKDKNGNSKEYCTNTTPEVSPFFKICEEATGGLARGDIYNLDSQKWFSVEYVKKNEWKYTSQMTGSQNNNYQIRAYTNISNPQTYKCELEFTAEEKASFIRLMMREMKGSKMFENIATKPLYYCPAYYDSTSNITCNLKGAYETNMGLAILSDAGSPVLAHTYYCSTDLGTDPEEWLYFGMETGVRSEKGGFTYTSDNFKHVPNGMYYTTVIHYADGTICMTDVKKMQK